MSENGSGTGAISTGETPKRRGRKPYPRDEYGNIIRPDGSTGGKGGGSPKSGGKPTLSNRPARKKEIVSTLVDINPLICQGMCLLTSVPVQYAMGIHMDKDSPDFGKVFITDIGRMLILPDNLIDVYGEAGSRFAETPLGIKLSANMGGIAPYLFVVMALISTGMWGANVFRAKAQLKPVVEQMKKHQQMSATEQQQRNEDILILRSTLVTEK